MENIFYRVIKKGTDEDKRKIINKMCELFFTLNVKLYKEYMLKNEKVFENFYHMEYLIFPISIKEFTYKNKKIIIEYYLLGEKVYTDKKNFYMESCIIVAIYLLTIFHLDIMEI
ncbi:hypothetical protein [uncultured Clostridium sp.]|uniref:hypothetical protein n=1 Tax=uncultured Clostridium sp. TaxID=59620 RepID=UPI00280ACD0A|nr:hypothetical protein [uncultured Clostridium sp.]